MVTDHEKKEIEEKEDCNPLLLDHDRGDHCVTHEELLNARHAVPYHGLFGGRRFYVELDDFIQNLHSNPYIHSIPNPNTSLGILEEKEEEEKKGEERKSADETAPNPTPPTDEFIEVLTIEGQIALTHIIMRRLKGEGRINGISASTMNLLSPATHAMNCLVNCILQGPDIEKEEEEEKDHSPAEENNHSIKELLVGQYNCIYPQEQIGNGTFATIEQIGESSLVIKQALKTSSLIQNAILYDEIKALRHLTSALLNNSGTGYQKKNLLQAFSLPICFLNHDNNHPKLVFWAAKNNLRQWCKNRYTSLNEDEKMQGSSTPTHKDFLKAYSQLAVNIYLALRYMHKHMIVHRDLKLENFLVESQGDEISLKLTDFGTSVYKFETDRELGYAPWQGITPSCTSPTMLLHHHDILGGSFTHKNNLERNDWWALGTTITDTYHQLIHGRFWLLTQLASELIDVSRTTPPPVVDRKNTKRIIGQLIGEMHAWRAKMEEISARNSVFSEGINTKLQQLWVRDNQKDDPISFEDLFDRVFAEEEEHVTHHFTTPHRNLRSQKFKRENKHQKDETLTNTMG